VVGAACCLVAGRGRGKRAEIGADFAISRGDSFEEGRVAELESEVDCGVLRKGNWRREWDSRLAIFI